MTQDGGEGFETWNIETGQRVEVFQSVQIEKAAEDLQSRRRTTSVNTTIAVRTLGHDVTAAKDVEMSPAKAIEALLRQHEEALAAVDLTHDEGEEQDAAVLHTEKNRAEGPGVTSVLIGNDYAGMQDGAVSQPTLPALSELQGVSERLPAPGGDTTWYITAGEDRKIRFLDTGGIERSSIVSGGAEGEDRPTYSVARSKVATIYSEETKLLRTAASGPNKRQALIAANQQTLLKAHQDAITALIMLELPFRCIVSGDRSGIIKIWE